MLVTIIYPSAPFEVIPGGVDTFIKGIIDYAPQHINFQVVGITTDPGRYRIGEIHKVPARNGRVVEFLPVLFERNLHKHSKISLSRRFALKLNKYKSKITGDILQFHCLEPSILFWLDKRPKTLFIHQSLRGPSSSTPDSRRTLISNLYSVVEKFGFKKFSMIHGVKETTVEQYKKSIPSIQEKIFFTPAWCDHEDFYFDENVRAKERSLLVKKYGFAQEDRLLIFVGRIDQEKDPLKLLRTIKVLAEKRAPIRLLMVGDGMLREEVEVFLRNSGLDDVIVLLGLQSKSEISKLLNAADLFVLPSRSEGAPVALLEAIATGLPVVVNNVGEVSKIINSSNGIVVDSADDSDFTCAVQTALEELVHIDRCRVANSAEQIKPTETLEKVYEHYASLVAS